MRADHRLRPGGGSSDCPWHEVFLCDAPFPSIAFDDSKGLFQLDEPDLRSRRQTFGKAVASDDRLDLYDIT